MNKSVTIPTIPSVATIPPGLIAKPGLILNGGFELGTEGVVPTYWRELQASGNKSSVRSHSGAFSLLLSGSDVDVDNVGYIAQRTAGVSYTFSFWYYIVSGTLIAWQADGSGVGDHVYEAQTGDPNQWNYATYTFTETAK